MTARGFMRLWVASLALAGVAAAHVTPLRPSLCAPTIAIDLPASGVGATVDAPTSADRLRIVYDLQRNEGVVCPASPSAPQEACAPDFVPRAFTLDGRSGTIVLPPAFAVSMSFAGSSGNASARGIPVTLAFDGAITTVPVDLTSGLATAGGAILEGVPFGRGALALVGVASGGTLPAPLGGAAIALRIACEPNPPPDLDQFVPAPVLGGTKSVTNAQAITVRATLSGAPSADFAAGPAMVRVAAGGIEIATASFVQGLTRQGRRWTAADDQTSVTVTRARGGRYTVSVRVAAPAFPAGASTVGLTLEVGGMVLRTDGPTR